MSTNQFRPMLAGLAPANTDQLSYPLYASPKLDGIRCVIREGQVLSRSLKPIANEFIQDSLRDLCELDDMDGELIVGDPTDKDVFNKSTSAIRRATGEPDFVFHVFDLVLPDYSFMERWEELQRRYEVIAHPRVSLLPQTLVECPMRLDEYEQWALSQGYEGVITRHPYGRYKFGRSTVKQEWLLKVKRFTDDEAEIIGFEELMHNDNEAVTNELGLTERSSHKENQVGMDMLGALVCRNTRGQIFGIGTGFTKEQRNNYWKARDSLLGETIKYKYFEVGSIDAPRHPVFVGFRMQEDLS